MAPWKLDFRFAARAVGRDRELGSRWLARSRHRLIRQGYGNNDRYRGGYSQPWRLLAGLGDRLVSLDSRGIDSLGPLVAAFPPRPFSRHAVTRTLLLAQLSARPWLLPPHLVLGKLQYLAPTLVFDEMLLELARGPLQQGSTLTPGRVTIGWGPRDHLLLPRQDARAQAAFPSAGLRWFEHCGHFPHWDQPADTARVIFEKVDGDIA